MAYNYEYPYVDAHSYNSDWILNEMKHLLQQWEEFVPAHQIKYGGLWEAGRSYDAYTIVTDQNVNTYLSMKAVPNGIALTNTEYWTLLAEFSAQLLQYQKDTNASLEEINTLLADYKRVTDIKLAEHSSKIGTLESANVTVNQKLGAMTQGLNTLDNRVTQNQTAVETEIGLVTAKVTKVVRGFLYPEDFGAVADNSTDNTEAFKALFAEAYNRGREVMLRSGDYTYNLAPTEETTFTSGITVHGNNGRIKISGNVVFTNCRFYDIGWSGTVSPVFKNCKIERGFVGGTIRLIMKDDGYIRDMRFSNANTGITVLGRQSVYIESCLGKNCTDFLIVNRDGGDLVGRYAILTNCMHHTSTAGSSFIKTDAPVDVHNCLFGGTGGEAFLRISDVSGYTANRYQFKISNCHCANAQISNMVISDLRIYGSGNTGVLLYTNRIPIAVAGYAGAIIGTSRVTRNIEGYNIYLNGMLTPAQYTANSQLVAEYSATDFGGGKLEFPCVWREGTSKQPNSGILEFNSGKIYLRGVPTSVVESIYYFCSATMPTDGY